MVVVHACNPGNAPQSVSHLNIFLVSLYILSTKCNYLVDITVSLTTRSNLFLSFNSELGIMYWHRAFFWQVRTKCLLKKEYRWPLAKVINFMTEQGQYAFSKNHFLHLSLSPALWQTGQNKVSQDAIVSCSSLSASRSQDEQPVH